jgi:hypothetical protein
MIVAIIHRQVENSPKYFKFRVVSYSWLWRVPVAREQSYICCNETIDGKGASGFGENQKGTVREIFISHCIVIGPTLCFALPTLLGSCVGSRLLGMTVGN